VGARTNFFRKSICSPAVSFPSRHRFPWPFRDQRGLGEKSPQKLRRHRPGAAAQAGCPAKQTREEPARKPARTAAAKSEKPATIDEIAPQPLFTFDTFVPGKANDLARAAALQVADNPGAATTRCSSMAASAWARPTWSRPSATAWCNTIPKARVRYIHADRYVSDMVRAVRTNSYDDFKRRYDSLDVLLIDDIQFFAGKEGTQEQFFYTFNTLIEEHKQVIITSDTFPKDMEGIEERLKSRFSWGLTVMLEPPELEMRVAILLDKARLEKANLDEGTAFFIAKQVRSNVRELEGALKRVIAFARFQQAIHLGGTGQGSPEGSARRAEPADFHREHPEDRGRLLQDQGGRHVFQETHPRPGPAKANGHVPGAGTDRPVLPGNRPILRRPRSHHRPARLRQDRGTEGSPTPLRKDYNLLIQVLTG
jgi:hypothetical protein